VLCADQPKRICISYGKSSVRKEIVALMRSCGEAHFTTAGQIQSL
jgi:hypothetical protein